MIPPDAKYYERLIYETLYPNHRQNSRPRNFAEFVQNCLVPEIRSENCRYYGPEDERGVQQDALYPAHDYSTKATRTRFNSYPGHAKFFAAIDRLQMTPNDINSICAWEGTRTAKERYEIGAGVKVPDITWDRLPGPSPRRVPTVTHHDRQSQRRRSTSIAEDVASFVPRIKPDYYDPLFWSNQHIPANEAAIRAEDTLRQALATTSAASHATVSTSCDLTTGLLSPPPETDELSQTEYWSAVGRRAGVISAGERDERTTVWLASHLPAHLPANAAIHNQAYNLVSAAADASRAQNANISTPPSQMAFPVSTPPPAPLREAQVPRYTVLTETSSTQTPTHSPNRTSLSRGISSRSPSNNGVSHYERLIEGISNSTAARYITIQPTATPAHTAPASTAIYTTDSRQPLPANIQASPQSTSRHRYSQQTIYTPTETRSERSRASAARTAAQRALQAGEALDETGDEVYLTSPTSQAAHQATQASHTAQGTSSQAIMASYTARMANMAALLNPRVQRQQRREERRQRQLELELERERRFDTW